MKNTLQNHSNTTSSSKKTNKFLLATALAGVLMTASCWTDNKKAEKAPEKEKIETLAPETENWKISENTINSSNTTENTVQNTGNNSNEEVVIEEIELDPETLKMLNNLDELHMDILNEELAKSEEELKKSREELAKAKKLGENLKAINKQGTTSIERLFNDPLINKENLEKFPDLKAAFCDAYWVYEEGVKEHWLQKSQRAKELEALYKKFKNK